MTLTPEAVRDKEFTTIRLREGYDMGEVDHFLDQVEQELRRLIDENESLRKLGSRGSDNGQNTSAPTTEDPLDPPSRQEQVRAEVEAETAAAASTTTTAAGAATVAARILEKAATAGDELVAEAAEQAESVLAEAKQNAAQLESTARADAERITNEAHGNASRMDAEAKTRLSQVTKEADDRRAEVFGRLQADQDELTHSIDELQQLEREYRARLKLYFTEQLQTLEAIDDGTAENRRTDTQPADGG